jgi:hypothetical protein
MIRDRIDFVGIGAPKCGTTWLSDCLAEHPEIGFAPDKEVYFFGDSEARTYYEAGFHYYERGPEWYHRQFPLHKAGAHIFGEYSVSYMYDPRCCERIRSYNPDIRVLIALRHPVDVVYSWYWYNRTGLISKLPETFEQAMEIPYFQDLGCYHRALAPYFGAFPRERIHVVFHEDIKRDPDAVLRDLFSFLGVAADFRPAKTGEKVNAAKTTRFPALQTLGNASYNLLKKTPVVSSVVGSRAFEKAVLGIYERVNRKPLSYAPISPETRKRLTEYYRPDVEKLEALLGRDLGSWKR